MHKRRSSLSSTALMLLGCGLIFISLCIGAARANEYADFEGIWRSKGYGYILDVTADSVTLYDTIPTFCIQNPEMADIFATYLILGKVSTNAEQSRLTLSLPFDQYEYVFERLEKLPARCTSPYNNSTDLVENFEAFVSYFTTHYASFEVHNVNWAETVTTARAQLDNISTPLELFALFKTMLKGLRDPHIQMQAIINNEEHYFVGYVSATAQKLATRNELTDDEALDELIGHYWMDNIPQKILTGKGTVDGNGYIQYGTKSQIGYIAILAEGDYAGKGAYHDQEDYEKLNQVLDDAHTLFAEQNVKGVILDLSINFGGYGFISRAIAERFTQDSYHAYSRRAADANDEIAQKIFVRPYAGKRFSWPTYVLMTDMTMSAGEMIVLMLASQDNIVLAGEQTTGAFSDVLAKKLPNGWLISMSNEVITDLAGQSYEAKGIPPQIALKVFAHPDPITGHVDAVSALVEMITNAPLLNQTK